MAEVYLAKSSGANGVNKFVAIKRILPQFSNNPEFISMFKEEAKVAINLSHSNIVSIYDFGIEQDQFFIVMEYVEGRNLRQIINEMKKSNKTFSLDQAVYMIKEAAAGLNHAHRCTDSQSGKPLNITHRDMSPQNIMVSFEGETKVIDFGIAKAESENEATKAGTLKGKFSYMSPEQSEGFPIDPRTDVFALGIILWELLANDRLFTGSNEGAILRKVRDCQIPAIRKINPLVPQELERIVMKALAKDKNVRYQTAANFHKDLNLFINTQYPDFSIHDFSQFIRDCFKVAYAEGKEKLIFYARISTTNEPAAPAIPSVSETVTAAISPATRPAPPMNPASLAKLKEFNGGEPVPQLEQLKGMAPESKEKISLAGLRSAAMGKKQNDSKIQGYNNIGQETRFTYTNHGSKTGFNKSYSNPKNKASAMDAFPKLALILVLGIIGFLGYKNLYNTPTKKREIARKAEQAKQLESGNIEMAATASTRLSVSSEPTGAKIFVDGVSTNQFTPAIVTVTSNKEVTITLIKEGFYKYQQKKTLTSASSLAAALLPTPAMGYLNIIVRNGGESPSIFINGVRLNEKLPIVEYAVPANQELEIEAKNPFANSMDKTKVKVMTNKIQTVELILGRKQQ
ncbi:MAG: serine/threonine protein kinase [Bdellovibrionaceae bacterium]|nr:serine/threonine protein kinase [Pseudobdellovibrionaceae bacterium]